MKLHTYHKPHSYWRSITPPQTPAPYPRSDHQYAPIFTFDIVGGKEEAHRFIDHLQIFSLLANVADVKSLVIHPATTTHAQLSEQELAEQNIRQSTIRLSIGTEHIDDQRMIRMFRYGRMVDMRCLWMLS